MQKQSPQTNEEAPRTAAATTKKTTRDKRPTTGSEKEEDPWISKAPQPKPSRPKRA